MILSINNIRKTFGHNEVLKNISLTLKKREKIALVGSNGAGKSTLFKILTKEISKDGGEVFLNKTSSLGYLSQVFHSNKDCSIYDYVKLSFKDLISLETKIATVQENINKLSGDELEKEVNHFSNLSADFERLKGYEYRSKIIGTLKGLGFPDRDFNKPISSLSGGQQTRLSLAKTLLMEPSILLLDEPTNHLDLNSIEWLENYLKNSNCALIIISHDRYFLDSIVSKVYEIEHGTITSFNGNFTDYIMQKEINKELELHAYLSQQNDLERQKKIIEKLLSFNREKSVKRANSKQKLLNKIDVINKPIQLDNSMQLKFSTPIQSGRDVLKIRALTMSFTDTILDSVDFDINRGEKIALVGDNGVGKTTLFKLILNELNSNSGTISLGSNVNIAYYDQTHSLLNDDFTIYQTFNSIDISITNFEVRTYLARFMFYEEDLGKKIATLSGGEKGRLSLAKIMYSKANFLLLDEPTNHLDVYSREILENAIKDYEGTVFYISHDRYFINSTADKVVELKNKKLFSYLGDYDYYIEKRTNYIDNTSDDNNRVSKTLSKIDREEHKELEKNKRKRNNKIKDLEFKLEHLEKKIYSLDLQLNDEKYANDPSELLEIFKKKESFECDYNSLFEQWSSITE